MRDEACSLDGVPVGCLIQSEFLADRGTGERPRPVRLNSHVFFGTHFRTHPASRARGAIHSSESSAESPSGLICGSSWGDEGALVTHPLCVSVSTAGTRSGPIRQIRCHNKRQSTPNAGRTVSYRQAGRDPVVRVRHDGHGAREPEHLGCSPPGQRGGEHLRCIQNRRKPKDSTAAHETPCWLACLSQESNGVS